MDEEVILQKSEKKKHKRIKEKEALSSSEVPTEEKKKHKKSKEKKALRSSEVSTDIEGAQKVKGSEEKVKGSKKRNREEEKEDLSVSEVPSENKKHKISKQKEALRRKKQAQNLRNKLVQGKRFTRQEDQIIKDAVHNYIEAHELGEKGLDMVLNCRKHPNIRKCWKEIGAALPYRPREAVYQRGHSLFERGESRNWTEDEKAFILKFYKKHGPDWKSLALVLGKNQKHVKDQWRYIYRAGLNRGKWTQTEYQSLFHLVNKDLQMRVYEEKKSKHGMRRDNISWQAISSCLATRTEMRCCNKWYNQLTSSMVKEGKWADSDDYRLLHELFRLDACCIEDVDWDNLLEHRPGDITLKRWRQMVNHIGSHGLQSFAGQVEVLANRYCPELLEVRELIDSKPVVD